MKGRVIAVVNAKGGAGKTTLACCMAAELAARGRSVTLIDADPMGGTRAWHDAGGPLQAVDLVVEPGEAVTDHAIRMAKSGGTVVIDAAGFATRTMVAVLEAADLVVVPCRPSGLDAVRAVETVGLAREVARAQHRRIPAWVLLNGVTRAAVVPHIRSELARAGVRVLAAELRQRSAFAVAALGGTAPCWMGASGSKAAADVAAVVDELGI